MLQFWNKNKFEANKSPKYYSKGLIILNKYTPINIYSFNIPKILIDFSVAD